MSWLINASQLDRLRKDQKNVILLDASWYLPADNRDAYQEFCQAHIVGARFFDLTQFHDTTVSLPNMLLRDEKEIGEKLAALGISNEHKIIFYDRSNLHTSCRALWMLKTFGHPHTHLYILDGGFAAWEKYGGKIEAGTPRDPTTKTYTVNFQAHLIRTLVQMKTNLHHPTEQVVDARHPIRYAGGPESRAKMRAGHIPSSFSFPYFTLFTAEGLWKPIEKIRKQLTGIGVNLDSPIVTMCGSGVTAAIINFALDLLNQENNALYDGSWSEWGSENLYPGETTLNERPIIKSTDQ
jgi:thiosulfate/3-mercaptopyruvate sulfurtransferase